MENVAILGASHQSHRYAYKAQKQLMEQGHEVYPVSLAGGVILDTRAYRSLQEIPEPVDTITVYVNSGIVESLEHEILAIKPRRVIFNPGSESYQVMQRLEKTGIDVQPACTLVLLSTGQF